MPLKKTQYRTPNRILIDTGHKTFDSQCDCLSTGNVSSNTQLSAFVRADSDISCNGFTFPQGHLFEADIKCFRSDMPHYLEAWIRGLNKTVIVYQIRHWTRQNGHAQKYVHGYIVTDTQYRWLRVTTTGARANQSAQVLATVLPYLATGKAPEDQNELFRRAVRRAVEQANLQHLATAA